jgi:transcriptional regulator NrdR family protein
MACPKCGSRRHLVQALGNGDSIVQREMNQIERYRECDTCAHRWPTLELPRVELQRLRALAHWAVMKGARP